MLNQALAAYPNLSALVAEVLAQWPEHARYLETSLAARDAGVMDHSETLATLIRRLATLVDGGLHTLAADYRFLCEEIVLPEEVHFRRHGTYRLSRFSDALASVYANDAFMSRYMNGLLVSDVLWLNHCLALRHYSRRFLRQLPPDSRLLEIGPGHGLLLHLAVAELTGMLSAWDVSQTSLDHSRKALDVLGLSGSVRFEKRDIFDPAIMEPHNAATFDAIVLSEVLEHLEEPDRAMRVLFHLCRPGGRVWINIPANSPAPDHLFLITTPKAAEDLVASAGFDVIEAANFPMAGDSLERAVRLKRTISCVVIGEKRALR